MEGILSLLTKLTVIFLGSGIVSLIAYFVAREAYSLPRHFLVYLQANKKNCKEIMQLNKAKKFKSESAFYELTYNSKQKIKLFSSPNGIKVFK